MEAQVERLVSKVWEKFQSLPPDQRYIILLAGVPGSGKTTLATTIASRLNAQFIHVHPGSASAPPPFLCISQDGFHLPRTALHAMSDPSEAVRRRGAPFTFDAHALLALLHRLREPLRPAAAPVYAPTFDHAKKDPVDRGVEIPVSARVIILEGNYVLLNQPVWRDVAAAADQRWFLDIELETATRRLIARHLATGVESTEEGARRRAEGSDLDNARLITRQLVGGVDEVIRSVGDPELAGLSESNHG